MNEEFGHRYRIGLPLAHYAIKQAQQLQTDNASIIFTYTGIPKISVIESLIGKSGWMVVKKITIASFETIDEVIISCITDDGTIIEPEIARRLFSINGEVSNSAETKAPDILIQNYLFLSKSFTTWLAEENARFFDEEMNKLDT